MRVRFKLFNKWLNYLSNKLISSYSIIYNVIKCNRIDGDCDNHAAGEIRREAHRLMERIGGFMQSH